MGKKIPLRQRFDEKWEPVPESGCWLWLGSDKGKNKSGSYGAISVENKMISAHRVSWILHKGLIPKDMHVLHKCDTPECVNPDHLFLGTHQDNMKDKVDKDRHNPNPRLGIDHQNSKLNENQVKAIRESDLGCRKLSQLYSMSKSAIQRIRNGKTWAHI